MCDFIAADSCRFSGRVGSERFCAYLYLYSLGKVVFDSISSKYSIKLFCLVRDEAPLEFSRKLCGVGSRLYLVRRGLGSTMYL